MHFSSQNRWFSLGRPQLEIIQLDTVELAEAQEYCKSVCKKKWLHRKVLEGVPKDQLDSVRAAHKEKYSICKSSCLNGWQLKKSYDFEQMKKHDLGGGLGACSEESAHATYDNIDDFDALNREAELLDPSRTEDIDFIDEEDDEWCWRKMK